MREQHITSLDQIPFARKGAAEGLFIANLGTSIIPEVTVEELKAQRCEWSENSSTALQALILPSDMMWPTFHDEGDYKSLKSECKHILFRRVALHALKREEQTEHSLNNNDCVIYVGIPGIGKTLALNYVLLRCLHSWAPNGLSHLKYDEFRFDRVIFRLGDGFYVITKTTKKGDERLSADVKFVMSEELKDVNDECDRHGYTYENTLLLLELREGEHEVDDSPVNYMATTSSRGANDVFKSAYKGNGHFYLMDPWSYPECLAMGRVLDAAAGGSADNRGSVAQKVETKFEYTGGVVRSLLRSKSSSAERDNLKNVVSLVFSESEHLTVFNVPSSWNHFVAPFVCYANGKDMKLEYDRNYEFMYLTPTLRDVVLSNAKTSKHVEILSNHRLASENH